MARNGIGEFVTIALPKDIVERLDKCIAESNHLYTSRPHIVKIALSKFFKDNGSTNCGRVEKREEQKNIISPNGGEETDGITTNN